MPKQRTTEEMKAYQRERRARVTPAENLVTPPESVTPLPETEVTPPGNVTPVVTPSIEVPAVTSSPILRQDERQALRSRLDAYREEYVEAARRQDWETCDRVNVEREPLFYELWGLEKSISPEKRYWFPARVINQGHVFQPENVRRGH